MSEYKSFQGKNVDDAIAEACRHFNCLREELEVEIISGGSSGIFGLVGVKKAKVKARKRQAVETRPAPQPPREPSRKEAAPKDKKPAPKRPAKPKPAGRKNGNGTKGASGPEPVTATNPPAETGNGDARAKVQTALKPVDKGSKGQGGGNGQARQKPSKPKKDVRKEQVKPDGHKAAAPAPAKETTEEKPVAEAREEAVSAKPAAKPEVDLQAAREFILESTRILLTNISEAGEIRVDMDKTPIEVVIEDEENSGLIIGRDGQTISSMQYLLNRIVSRKHPGVARIQLDAGDYREKQDEQLRKTAEFLAQKAKASHRTQSTRPLSSYHRRVVHLALQEARDIMTRSKGDGPMKRVLIMARRKKNNQNGGGRNGTHNGNGRGPAEQVEQTEQAVENQAS